MDTKQLPPLHLSEWEETKITLHLFTQIVGKIRLMLHPEINHWWHAPLYVSSRGLSTRTIPYENGLFEIEFDLVDHRLNIRTSTGNSKGFDLAGNSVSGFYSKVRNYLEEFGIDVKMLAQPFDSDRVKSNIEFNSDTKHEAYDKVCVQKFWSILSAIEPIFKEFRGRFIGKCSPVHFFWHSFDLAVTRFSGRPATVAKDADPVTKEAYSHEVISEGFWPGDDNMKEPSFYTYVHPEPKGLDKEKLLPDKAWWQAQNGTHMALYKYEDFRTAGNPKESLLSFFQSAYDAGATLAKWPRKELERPE